MERILVVDSNVDFLATLSSLLVESGYDVTTATDSSSFFSSYVDRSPDLVLLDVELGAESGFELLLRLRRRSDVPAIVLSDRDHETDQVVGLELGADDYIAKPYRSAELIARIRSVLRRSRIGRIQDRDDKKSVAHFANWSCDLVHRKLISPTDDEVALTSGEFLLLAAFVENPDRVLSRKHLLELTHRGNTVDRSIDVQIMRLRRKFGDDKAVPELIQSVRSIGYVFAARVEWT